MVRQLRGLRRLLLRHGHVRRHSGYSDRSVLSMLLQGCAEKRDSNFPQLPRGGRPSQFFRLLLTSWNSDTRRVHLSWAWWARRQAERLRASVGLPNLFLRNPEEAR